MWLMLSTSVVGNMFSDGLSHVLYVHTVREHQAQVPKSSQDDYAVYRDTVCSYSSRMQARGLVEFVLLPSTVVGHKKLDCIMVAPSDLACSTSWLSGEAKCWASM
jgi:hypothetical protein